MLEIKTRVCLVFARLESWGCKMDFHYSIVRPTFTRTITAKFI